MDNGIAPPPVGWEPASRPIGTGNRTVPGVMALAGSIGLLVACVLPISPDYSILPAFGSQSIDSYAWYSVEPVASAVIILLLALAFLARSVGVRSAGGFFLGIGIAEALLFLGFVGSAAFSSGDLQQDVSAASVVGLASGVVVLLSGVIAVRSNDAAPNGSSDAT